MVIGLELEAVTTCGSEPPTAEAVTAASPVVADVAGAFTLLLRLLLLLLDDGRGASLAAGLVEVVA